MTIAGDGSSGPGSEASSKASATIHSIDKAGRVVEPWSAATVASTAIQSDPAPAATNYILLITYNNLDLLQPAVASALAQTVPNLKLWIIDNGSTDETAAWLADLALTEPRVCLTSYQINKSPVAVANAVLDALFSYPGSVGQPACSHILTMPNDVVLPPQFYSELLACPRGVVTASMTSAMNLLDHPILPASAVNECTPMAVVLWRRWAWQAVTERYNYFLDPGFWHYASDCDLALRLAALGIHGVQLDLPFWHYGSAAWRLAEPRQQQAQLAQADRDREYFAAKWGWPVDDPRYTEAALDINFRGEPYEV